MKCPICGVLAGEFRDKEGVTYTCNNPDCTWTGERIVFPKREEPKWNWGNEKKDQTTETDIFGNPKKKKDDKKKKNDPPWKFW